MTIKNPTLIADIEKIEYNAKVITTLCQHYNIQVAAVTKGVCAEPEIAEAMLRGGCTMLADSRLENLQLLREQHFDVDHLLLRLPMISEIDEVVRLADISLNSEIATIKALNSAAQKQQTTHRIILMIDVGDLREGIWPETIHKILPEILQCEYIIFEGIGCNLGCYGGVIPSPENMGLLLQQKLMIETSYPISVNLVSGGTSTALQLVASGKMPKGINHFRVGEAILLGRNPVDRSPFPGTCQDAFIIQGEIIECQWKPSVPLGQIGQDAFGHLPVFEDRGIRLRAILALGRQDIAVNGLTPCDPKIQILGASSDHLLIDITETHHRYQVGSTISFFPNYAAVLAASTSRYIRKICINS
ncbi:alanine racemase domain protein [Candidatus Vecturithrix granuli]|uniref:Alanine racemase domain protein n=1 Tax=Vecturithrix granuli TaxID=1499967 RepID=A0A081BX34_VECG1|nr:alanine racemase domain protein [Candidatus Vecturithrix granuli]